MPSADFGKYVVGAGILGALVFLFSRAAAQSGSSTLAQDAISSAGATSSIGVPKVKITETQKSMVALIQTKAQDALIDPAFMVALAVTESSLNPATVGDDGKSFGLFQLTVAAISQFSPDVTPASLLDGELNAGWAMLYMRKYFTDFPGFTYADYAEAWTLGAHGRFQLGRRNPLKIINMNQASTDLGLTLNLGEVPT